MGLNDPQCSDKCFHMRSIGASEYHFGEYKHIRMDGLIWGGLHFFGIFGFLQKTLAAHISAPRRGTEAVQYSKLSSGGPLCSQTSSSPWGSIIRAPEPQNWAKSKILKNSKYYPFEPKNSFFGVQKAENGCRTSMSPIIHWKYAIEGENGWKNCQFTVFFSFFHLFQHF